MRRFWTKRTSEAPTWMAPPPFGPLRFDPSVRTAGELMHAGEYLAVPEITHAAA